MTDASTESLQRQIAAAKRLLAIKNARESLLDFQRLRMPDPMYPEDPERSAYAVTPQAKLLCETLEKVERGELLRVCVSIGPQQGKSELISRGFPAWFHGRNPYKHLMLGTYNQDFANDFGGEVREIIESRAFQQVFPEYSLRRGSKAKDDLKSTKGGRMAFLGRGGSGTGKPSDIFIIDDPLKDDKEAQSPTIRRDLWSWFNKVSFTRCHRFSAIVIVHTRWHEDDLIGRLVDPDHPDHDPKIAAKWTYINIPSVVKDPKLAEALGLTLELPTDENVIEMFGRRGGDGEAPQPVPMAALWEDRKPLAFLAEAKRLDPRGFEALYQGNPAPEDGEYFKSDWLVGYKSPGEIPKNLRIYAASDHAGTEKQENDASVLGCVGVDENDEIWVLPDLVWDRMESDQTVEEMLMMMRRRRPMVWWAEDDMLQKGFGPFLRRRMREENVFCTVIPTGAKGNDLRLRARSIQGMMSLKRVHFPVFAPWWQEAKNEILKFPNATHDDFVSWLGYIGLGLDVEIGRRPKKVEKEGPRVGSLEWVKARSDWERKRANLRLVNGGM